jgi:hypothetical protein
VRVLRSVPDGEPAPAPADLPLPGLGGTGRYVTGDAASGLGPVDDRHAADRDGTTG